MERQRGRPLSVVLTIWLPIFLSHPVKTKQKLGNWYVGFSIHLKEIRHDPQTCLATSHVSCRAYVEADLSYNVRSYILEYANCSRVNVFTPVLSNCV